MKNRFPLVSVGIPTYNRPEGLRRTLECITQQTYKNLEIIISDNCSPGPETESVAREFMEKDYRIQYFRQPENKCAFWACFNFKFVLEKATGEYFMWAADDDEWDPKFIDSLVGVLDAHKNISVAHCQTTYRLAHEKTILPTFSQGLALNSLSPSSSKRRLRCAVQENFGELFYGIFRKNSLISDDMPGRATVDFEHYGLIHAPLKAMSSGDAYVSRDFNFLKNVTEDVFLWTYLCAKKKSRLSTNKSIEKILEARRNQRRRLHGETIISRLRIYLRLARSSIQWHLLFLMSALKTIGNLNIPHRDRLFFVYLIVICLLRSAFWTVATRIKWSLFF